MANISQIILPSGDIYDIKDSTARDEISELPHSTSGTIGGFGIAEDSLYLQGDYQGYLNSTDGTIYLSTGGSEITIAPDDGIQMSDLPISLASSTDIDASIDIEPSALTLGVDTSLIVNGDTLINTLTVNEETIMQRSLTVNSSVTANSFYGSSLYIDDCLMVYIDGDVVHLGDDLHETVINGSEITYIADLNGTGNATITGNASVSGSLSTYGFTVPRFQYGSVSVTATASSVTQVSVTFPTAYSSTPQVFLNLQHYSTSSALDTRLYNCTTTGFTANVSNTSTSSLSPTLRWVALY